MDAAFIGSGSPDTPSAGHPAEGDVSPQGTYGTMYRDRQHKLSLYHGHSLGELYDLQRDPWEFENLWDEPAGGDLKVELTKASFDASIFAGVDVGTGRIAPM